MLWRRIHSENRVRASTAYSSTSSATKDPRPCSTRTARQAGVPPARGARCAVDAEPLRQLCLGRQTPPGG